MSRAIVLHAREVRGRFYAVAHVPEGLVATAASATRARTRFSLAAECVGEPLAEILQVAAAIPLGYVTSYGNVAKASGAEARDVGRVMATKPLYPIVPCHRVVGADLSLVGYTGSRARAALQARLARLEKEARGFSEERDVLVDGRPLRVYPVEWAIAKAAKGDREKERQRSLFD